jgi:hypothetical protein
MPGDDVTHPVPDDDFVGQPGAPIQGKHSDARASLCVAAFVRMFGTKERIHV